MERQKYNTLSFMEQATIDNFWTEIQETGCTIEHFVENAAWEEEWTGTKEELQEAIESKEYLQS